MPDRHRAISRIILAAALLAWLLAGVLTIVGGSLPEQYRPGLIGIPCALAATCTLAGVIYRVVPSAMTGWQLGYRAGREEGISELTVPAEWSHQD